MPWFTFSAPDFALSFLSIIFEGIPFLLLGALISGLVDVFVSPERLSKILPKNPTAAILLSGLLGLIFPMCECGSIVVIRRFIRKGLPLSCAMTYMLGAPIVSPIVAVSTYAAFRGQSPFVMTSLRLLLGYLIAVGAGIVIQRFKPSSLLRPEAMAPETSRGRTGLSFAAAPTAGEAALFDPTAPLPLHRKLLAALQSATADFLDVTFFFIIGTAFASLFNTAVNQQIILPFATNHIAAILIMMLLAVLLALCSTTDAFVAASFSAFPPSAKLAFMVLGPVLDLKLFWLYGLVFRKRFVFILAAALFAVVLFLCWQASHVIDPVAGMVTPTP